MSNGGKRKGKSEKPIRVGVIGLQRGVSFANGAEFAGMKLVALCDKWKSKLQQAAKRHKVAAYTNYDRFLEHDMDAVVLANYFHEHAPFAIKALRAGKHVMSETSACKTVGEGVALIGEVEQSKKIYMFAENYPYSLVSQEMRRVYRSGEIGEMQYAEGEYQHMISQKMCNVLGAGLNHWRNHIPSTYYLTHALAPIMYITGTKPVSVNAHSIPWFPHADRQNLHVRRGDCGSVILCRMDNDALVTINGLLLRGHGTFYRVHGTGGVLETVRGSGKSGMVRIFKDEFDLKRGEEKERIYKARFPRHANLAQAAGHGGGDFFTNFHFAEAIRKNKQPWLNVIRGVAMTVAGIQAWKSCLNKGAEYEIPDFKKKSVRKEYENDNWSPFPEDAGPGQPPPSIKGFTEPSKRAVAYAKKVWKEIGYAGE